MVADYLKKCHMCPRNCNINRYEKEGACGATNKIKVARASLHYYEEPCISLPNGSGTVFFSGCNLKCVFCQNYNISTNNFGKYITVERLAEIFLELQIKKAQNINLVTPTHYTIQIKKAIEIAKANGLTIPIIYNSSGYENVNTLKMLEGLIDIYLPDMKYYSNAYAIKYSKCPNYFKICSLAIKEMYRQTGKIKFDKNGLIQKGLIVRHMILPNMIEDSKKIINYLHKTYKNSIYISIMNQYTPKNNLNNFKEINRPITKKEYEEVINYAINIGVENAYIQEDGTCKDSFIPEFDNTGI